MNDSGYKGLGFGFGLRFILFALSVLIIFISLFMMPENHILFDNLLLFSLIFFFIVLLFNASIVSKKNILSLDKGQIRRSIAIVFTLVYLILIFKDPNGDGALYENFTMIYGVIIAFYFGSRILEKHFKN